MEKLKEKIIAELARLAAVEKGLDLRQAFQQKPVRALEFYVESMGIRFDYSKNLLNEETLSKLLFLAEACHLSAEIIGQFKGEKINRTENRAVLHSALRNFTDAELVLDGENILPMIRAERKRMLGFADEIFYGKLLGATGQKITQVINIGIGGSDLGPRMAVGALEAFSNKGIQSFFVSNVDPMEIETVLTQLDPEKCLFVLASKTFTTLETMANAKAALAWYQSKLGDRAKVDKAFVALSSNVGLAQTFGIDNDKIFPMWDWVGGRYSLPSSIGLSLACKIGSEQFIEFLKGMEQVDRHFREMPFNKNIPVLMALLGYWYRNFLGAETLAVLPYSAELKLFPAYLQQLEMESNGKNIDRQGLALKTPSCPIVWGAVGTDSQHSFFQLLHQGTSLIPADFIGFRKSNATDQAQHRLLMANFIAQQQALAFGRTEAEVRQVEKREGIIPFKVFSGNRPTTSILMERLTPSNLGKLITLYEQKVFTQGVLWNLFSFDQWGVELGKELSEKIQRVWTGDSSIPLDSSTARLVDYCSH